MLLARSMGSTEYPARVQVVLAANPCPCANPAGDQHCECAPQVRRRYRAKLSGPLLDRIDIQLNLVPIRAVDLMSSDAPAESSAVVATRVAAARAAAAARWSASGWRVNAEVPGTALRRPPWRLPARSTALLRGCLDRGSLSARGFDRIIRLAWTVADLDGAGRPGVAEVSEATQLRMGDPGMTTDSATPSGAVP